MCEQRRKGKLPLQVCQELRAAAAAPHSRVVHAIALGKANARPRTDMVQLIAPPPL